MQIEIVTHAYAAALPQYATFLDVQLRSILHCSNNVRVTVCYTLEDENTFPVLVKWKYQLGDALQMLNMPRAELGKRSIGRNRAALASTADLVWFADADYFWHQTCFEVLEGIWEARKPRPTLMWPRTVWTQTDEETGDRLLERLRDNPEMEISTDAFVPKHYRKAIGGIQIIAGDYCRRYGYLAHDRRRQKPVSPGDTMFVTTEDSAIRKHIALRGEAMEVELPGVYRLRHTRNAYQYPEGRPPRGA